MMARGDVVVAAARGAPTGEPRPAVVVQADAFAGTDSVVLVPMTSREAEAGLLRVPVEARDGTGLRAASWMMVDKITAIPREAVGARIGRLAPGDAARLDRALLVLLGIA